MRRREAGQYSCAEGQRGKQRARGPASGQLDGEEELEHGIDEMNPRYRVGSFCPHETISFSLFINMGQKLDFY